MSKSADYEDAAEELGYGGESGDESSDGDGDEEILQKDPRPNAVYNSLALHEKLEEIAWPEGLDWMQTLCVDYHVEEEIDVEDDLAREMAFYTQALEGTREAFTLLLPAGTPFLRPPDYYAEMVKSDSHMLKVKDMLLSQQKQMEEAEERRKAREAKRFAKEVQAQKLKQRAQEKKQNIESVKKWRKMRQDQGFDGGEDEFPVDFDNGDDGGDGSLKKKRQHDGPREGAFKKFKGPGSNAKSDTLAQEKPNRKAFVAGKGMGAKMPRFGSQGSKSPKLHKKNPSMEPAFRSSGSHRSLNAAPWDRSGGKVSISKARKGKASQKRQSRDAKYGHGGRKRLKKANTAESSAGFSGARRKKGKF